MHLPQKEADLGNCVGISIIFKAHRVNLTETITRCEASRLTF